MDTGLDLVLDFDACGLLDTTGFTGTLVAIGVEATVTGRDDEREVGSTEVVDGVVVVEEVAVDNVVVVFGAPQVAASLLVYGVPGVQEIGPQSAAKAVPGTKVATVGVCPRLLPRSS